MACMERQLRSRQSQERRGRSITPKPQAREQKTALRCRDLVLYSSALKVNVQVRIPCRDEWSFEGIERLKDAGLTL